MSIRSPGRRTRAAAHCRRRRSALPDHEWVTSGCFAYRAPISCIDPRDALAVGEGLARMTTPASLARLGWLHFYGSALPTRVLPPVARLYFGVPSRRRRAFWDRLWPMLSDAIPVIEAKILDDARLARNDSVAIYLPVESAGLADALAAEALALVPARVSRPPLTFKTGSGAGIAESPEGASFGQRRARQIARCYVRAEGDVRGTVTAFVGELGQDGATAERPWICTAACLLG